MSRRSAIARNFSAFAASIAILALIIASSATAQRGPNSLIDQLRHLATASTPSSRSGASSSTPQVATPTLQLAPGYYPSTQTLTITDATAGATIYYTTDGTAPYLGTRFNVSAQQYAGPITISTSEIVVAIAMETGQQTSETAVGRYLIGSSQSSFIYTVAGTGLNGYAGDSGPAVSALLNGPWGVALDSAGNIYVADTGNNVIRKIEAKSGTISTIAGTSIRGTSGDGGLATNAQLDAPYAIAIDKSGNVFTLADQSNTIRRIDAISGIISTIQVSNNNTIGLGYLYGCGLAFDPAGNLYMADCYRGVWKIDQTTGSATMVAGSPSTYSGYSGDGGPATSALLNGPTGIAFDSTGNLYIADTDNSAIRMVNTSGIISTVAGGPTNTVGGDGGPATKAGLAYPEGVTLDSAGNLYIADTNHAAIRIVNTSGIINTLAGPEIVNDISPCGTQGVGGDGDPATSVCLFIPTGIVSDPTGNIYFADFGRSRIRKITPPMAPPTTQPSAPVFSLGAGTYATPQSLTISDSTPGAAIYVNINSDVPTGITEGYHGPIDLTGTATVTAVAIAPGTVASSPTSATFTITQPPSSIMTTVAGSGIIGFSGAGGPATAAEFAAPWGIAADKSGNLYIADTNNDVVWKVDSTTGNISFYAGTGSKNGSGDGTLASAAAVVHPYGLAVDSKGNLYISQIFNGSLGLGNVVRKVDASTGIITTFASGFNNPEGLAIDSVGNLYVADTSNARVRKVDAQTGAITTVAGGSGSFDLGDGGPATSAYVYPNDVAVDNQGNLYITDAANYRIRKVDATTGIITTIAGNGDQGYGAPGILATNAEVEVGLGIAVDSAGNVYFSGYPVVQKIDAATGILSTVAGNTYFGFNGDGLSATVAGLFYPTGLTFDPAGNLYIADIYEDRVRKVVLSEPAPPPTFDPPAGTYAGAQSVTISDAVPSATIYYTTDGSTPTTSSTQYTGSIAVTKSETINAIAVASGYGQSPIGSAAYVIQTTPTITWAAPAAITYGTALSSTQLDATASVGGTFAYSPAAGTILTAGAQTLNVTFTPTDTADYTTATNSVSLTVNQATPAITLASSANPADISTAITFTATVSSAAGTPTGSVTFFNGTTQLGTGTVAKGSAAFTTSALTAGSYSITAQYAGDSNFTSATSSAVTQVVNSFTVGPPSGGSNSSTVSPGGTASFNLSVTPPGNNPVTFSVSGLPPGATSSFSPGTIPAGAPATKVTLSVTVPSSAAATIPDRPGRPSRMPLAFGLVLLPLLSLRRWRKGSSVLLTLMLCIAGATGLAVLNGCGGGGGNMAGGGGGGQQPQSYTLTVTATAGTQTQTTTLTLTVQ